MGWVEPALDIIDHGVHDDRAPGIRHKTKTRLRLVKREEQNRRRWAGVAEEKLSTAAAGHFSTARDAI